MTSVIDFTSIKILEVNISTTGYLTINYPIGFTKENTLLISQAFYDTSNQWAYWDNGDGGIARCSDDAIYLYAVNSAKKIRIVVAKIV